VPLNPTDETTRAFASSVELERWLAEHHATTSELWVKFYKKGSGVATVTYQEAVDVALCWGWIDGIVKKLDERAYVQRFTPRGKKSIWSKINVENVGRLIDAGRMTSHGLRHVEAAKADGRWDAAYASPKNMAVSGELLRAIEASPSALATFEKLDRQSRYAMAFRFGNLKTEAGRAKRISEYVAMLAEGRGPFGPAQATPSAPTRKPGKVAPERAAAKKTPAKKRARPPAERPGA
jgi:uncharacterized protein YdeI (YjbR/CyaY-like superfamily)